MSFFEFRRQLGYKADSVVTLRLRCNMRRANVRYHPRKPSFLLSRQFRQTLANVGQTANITEPRWNFGHRLGI
jgi:hypothetical protein